MKNVKIWVLFIVGIGMCSYFFAALGYFVGGPQYSARYATTDIAYTVEVLSYLRNNDKEKAIDLLEERLNSSILEHSSYNSEIASALDWSDKYKGKTISSEKAIMQRVSAYRNKYQSPKDTPAVSNYIKQYLKKFNKE